MRKAPNPQIFLVMAILTLLVGAGAVWMQFGALTSQQDKANALRKEARDERSIRAEVDASAKKLSDCATELAHLEKGVPDSAYVPTMLSNLERTGRDSGMEVVGVRPMPKPDTKVAADGAKAKRKPYDELDIQVNGHGNYASVMRFINALNEFPKIVAARSVTISPKAAVTKSAPQDVLDVQIELRAYVFPVKADITAGGSKQNG